MRRGFTLVELLAVIVILGMILVILMPSITDLVNGSEDDVYTVKEEMLEKAAYDYILFSNTALPTNTSEELIINLTDLVTNKFASPIYDLKDETYKCSGYVSIMKISSNNYDYKSCLFCKEYQTERSDCDIAKID